MNTEKKSVFSLKRLSLAVGLLGLITLGAGIGFSNYASYKETADLLQLTGLSIMALSAVVQAVAWRQNLLRFSQTRQARFGANSLAFTLAFIGVVLVVNYLVYRHDYKIDLTENKSFTLSEQTQKILRELQAPVKVSAFYRASNAQRQDILNRLERFRDVAPTNFSFEMIDPDRRPGDALRLGVTADGTLMLESGKSRKQIYAADESQLISAVLAVSRSDKPKVYFLTGHNEADIDSYDPRLGLGYMKRVLEQESYEVAKLALPASKNAVPADADAVVIAGPEKAITADERKALQDYLDKRQGKLLVLLQPRVDSGLEPVLSKYGLQIGKDIVVDPGQNIQNDITVPAFRDYGFHPITKDMNSNIVFLPLARSVKLQQPPATVQATELLKTSPASWGETNLEENSLIRKDPADPAGPLSVAVALTQEAPDSKADDKKTPDGKPEDKPEDKPAKPQTRLVVIGNAMFASNGFSQILGNGDLFLNSVAWLTEADSLISVRAKAPENRQLQLTGAQERWVFSLSLYVMPLIMLLIGAVVWWRRR